MVNKIGPSQLQNNPDRFENASTDLEDRSKNDAVKKMVIAALRDADAMLFHIYAEAAKRDTQLTPEESQMVVKITQDKIEMLTKLGGDADGVVLAETFDPPHIAQRMEKLEYLMANELNANGHTDAFEKMHEEMQSLIHHSRPFVQ